MDTINISIEEQTIDLDFTGGPSTWGEVVGKPTAVDQNSFMVSGASPYDWQVKTLSETQSILGASSSLPATTAENDVVVGSATIGTWVKKTLAQFKTILGLGTAAYQDTTAFRASTYKGAYDAEIAASPTTGTLTLKNSTETVLETTLTNSNTFTVAMPTPTAGQVNESVLIFSIGATLPTITQPVGIVWRGTAPTLAINKTYTIVYEQINTTGSTFVLYAVGVQNA